MRAMAAMALQSGTGVFGLQVPQIDRQLLVWGSSLLPRGCGTADLRMIVRHGMNRLRVMPQETALNIYCIRLLGDPELPAVFEHVCTVHCAHFTSETSTS